MAQATHAVFHAHGQGRLLRVKTTYLLARTPFLLSRNRIEGYRNGQRICGSNLFICSRPRLGFSPVMPAHIWE